MCTVQGILLSIVVQQSDLKFALCKLYYCSTRDLQLAQSQVLQCNILTCICLTAGVNLLTPSGHRQIRDVITTGIDMCGRRMRKGGEGWTIHPSRRWLISCARTMVLYVCFSIALTFCATSMAETKLDAIRKQKNAEYSKRYRLKRKMKMQQQAPTTSEAETRKITSIVSALWYKHRIMYMSYRGLIRVTRICRQKT